MSRLATTIALFLVAPLVGCFSHATNVKADYYGGRFDNVDERCANAADKLCLVLRPNAALHLMPPGALGEPSLREMGKAHEAKARADVEKTCRAKIAKDNVRYVAVLVRAYETTQRSPSEADVKQAQAMFTEACGVDAGAVERELKLTAPMAMGDLIESW